MGWWIVAMLTALLMTPAHGCAQNITGEIDGTVSDAQGKVVPTATVNIVNADTKQLVRVVTADAKGDYTTTLLQVGNYNIDATAAGFDTSHTNDVYVDVGDTLTINLKLLMAGASPALLLWPRPKLPM
jgi:uncharacterized surface anchored protein